MKATFGATFLAAAFLAALVIPSTVLAGGGGGGRGGGGVGGMGAMSGMGGASIRNQTRMENQIRTPDVERLRMRDGEGDRDRVRSQDRDRDRDRIHKLAGTGPAATTTGSAVSANGEKSKKGNTYGPGDGTGPSLLKDGTGYGAPANR